MLSIRLRRMGARKDPHFRVVVADRSAARDGAFVEILGHYHPRETPSAIDIDLERARYWIDQGANVSDTVRSLMKEAEERAEAMEASAKTAATAEGSAETAEDAEKTEESSEDAEESTD